MIIDLLGLVIPCLISSTIIFFILDILIFRWALGLNGRIIAFLIIFCTLFGSCRTNLAKRLSNEAGDNYNKKTPIAVEYERITKQE